MHTQQSSGDTGITFSLGFNQHPNVAYANIKDSDDACQGIT